MPKDKYLVPFFAISLLCSDIAVGLPWVCQSNNSLQPNSAFDGHPANNFVRDEMVTEYRRRAGIDSEAPDLRVLLPENPFFISREKVEEIKKILNISTEQLLRRLVPIAKELARPPISNYYVGAAGLGKSGNIYLGVNLEFPGFPLNQTVHGEQFVVINALNNGEEGLLAIAVSAAPCGYCRQFLNELVTNKELKIYTPEGEPRDLSSLLPENFGPQDLGVKSALLSPQENCLKFDEISISNLPPKYRSDSLLLKEALDVANKSYSPYSNTPSGIALKTRDGKIYKGSYVENAAYNPSLSPLQAALIALVADGGKYSDIIEAILVEKEEAIISQESISRELLKSIAPEAEFDVYLLPPRTSPIQIDAHESEVLSSV